jgi:MFS family permease
MEQSNLQQKPTWYSWLVWLLGSTFYFYEFLLQVSPNVMMPDLSKHFHINALHFGYLATFYFIAYSIMQIPAGVLMDKYGARRLLTLAALVCACGTLLLVQAPNFFFVELARFATGIGSAFALLGTLVLASRWFSHRRFAMLTGITIMLGMLGAIFGQRPLAIMINLLGWQFSLHILAIVGFIIAALIWLIVRDNKNPLQTHNVAADEHQWAELMASVYRLIKSPQAWLIALYGVLLYGPTATLGAAWGATFVGTIYGLSRADAATYITVIFFGWVVGSPILGIISDWLQRRKPVLYAGAIGGLLSSLVIAFVHLPSLKLLALFMFIFGFFSSGFLPGFSLIRETQPAKAHGAALGFMNMINSLGGAIAPPIVGVILDLTWQGTMVNGVPVYSTMGFHIAIGIIPLSMLLAIITLFFVKEPCK